LLAAVRANHTRPDGPSGAFNDKEAFVLSRVSNNQPAGYGAGADGDDSSTGPLIGMINGANDVLNSPALSSVGQALNKLGPVGQAIHFIPDFFIGQLGSKLGEGIAHMFGEKGTVKTHFEKEWLGRDDGLKTDASNGKEQAHGKDRWNGPDELSTRRPTHQKDFPLPGLNGHHTRISTKSIEVVNASAF
jgi:hypothetical protein